MTARELVKTIDHKCTISVYEGVTSEHPYIYSGSPNNVPSWLMDYKVEQVEALNGVIIISLRFGGRDGTRRAKVTAMALMAVIWVVFELVMSGTPIVVPWQLHAAISLAMLSAICIVWRA